MNADPRELSNRAALEPALAAELDRLVEERAAGRPVVPNLHLRADERSQLEALGYLRGAGRAPGGDRALGTVGGIDPKRGAADAERLDELGLLLAQRRGREALAVYDAIQARGYVLLMMGSHAALLASEPERAEREARLALALQEQPEPWIAIGEAQLQQQRLDEARESFERALALDPGKATAAIALGWLDERAGRRDEAIRHYQLARAASVPSPAAFWRLAALALEDGRRDEARALLAEVPQAELRTPEAAQRLARAEQSAGRPELARTRVEGALREYPWISELWLLKADVADELGDLETALAARREALRLAPGRPEAENAVAWTLARLGRDLPEAEQRVEAALERLGRLPPLLDTYASVRTAQGRFADALALADEGLTGAADAARVDLLFRRAEALAGLGRRDAAEQALALAQREATGRAPASSSWSESERRVRRLLGAES